jgi:hypothetical protein
MSKFKTNIIFEPMKGFGGGFRQGWISGSKGKTKFGLDSGAGLGNPFVTLWVEKNGEKTKYYTADMAKVLESILEQVFKDTVKPEGRVAGKTSNGAEDT